MLRQFHNINIKLIALELAGLLFAISGLKRFYVAFHALEYEAIANNDFEKLDGMYDKGFFQFYLDQAYWMLGFTVVCILSVWVLNRINKIKPINSIVITIVIIGLSFAGFFVKGPFNQLLDMFCEILSTEFAIAYFIGGLVLSLIGTYTMWFTLHQLKKPNELPE